MNKEIEQQVVYLQAFLNIWLKNGPKSWDYKNQSKGPMVDLSGSKINADELCDMCIEYKRKGDYANAIGGMTKAMAAYYDSYKKIPIFYAKGLFKILMCANYFYFAFSFAGTVLSDIQTTSETIDKNDEMNFTEYYKNLFIVSMQVIDQCDFSNVSVIASNYSGNPNYSLVKTRKEIFDEFNLIRQHIKKVYNM